MSLEIIIVTIVLLILVGEFAFFEYITQLTNDGE